MTDDVVETAHVEFFGGPWDGLVRVVLAPLPPTWSVDGVLWSQEAPFAPRLVPERVYKWRDGLYRLEGV